MTRQGHAFGVSLMIDNDLMTSIINYNIRKKYAFSHYENWIPNYNFDKILNKRYCKNSRIKKRLVYLLTHFKYTYFVTFTFNDKLINRSTRFKRDLIKDTLFNFDEDYKIILNVDYGSQTEREHYHAIISTDSDYDLSFYLRLTYPSFTKVLPVGNNFTDITRLSKYINKLANHCTKDSTKNFRIYYNFKGYDELPSEDSRKLYIIQKQQLIDTRT